MKIASFAKSREEQLVVDDLVKKLELDSVSLDKTSSADGLFFVFDGDGLALSDGSITLRGDFNRLLPRLKINNLHGEAIFKAMRGKNKKDCAGITVVDATAGLGEDSFLLAGAGCTVTLIERNPVVAALLNDALRRGLQGEKTREICVGMRIIEGDSADILPTLGFAADVVLLDPMFPQRQKSALVKKKLQLIRQLEQPCADEEERTLFDAAKQINPKKIIVKRPKKGGFLAKEKPSYSVDGGGVRYDCYVFD